MIIDLKSDKQIPKNIQSGERKISYMRKKVTTPSGNTYLWVKTYTKR